MTASGTTHPDPAPDPDPARPRRPLVLTFLFRLVLNGAVPVVVYFILRPHVSDLTALASGAAIPVLYTVGAFAWRQHVDAVGVIAIACFGVGLLAAIVTRDNEMAFKLREEIWTGPLGLAFLISAPLRRPLLLLVMQFLGRTNADIAERIRRPAAPRILAVSTVVVGATLIVHAVVLVLLALNTSTATFLAVHEPIGLATLAVGLVPLVWWIRHQARGRPGASA